MSSIQRFEDLIVWQKSRELNKRIYSITSDSNFNKDYSPRDQIRRASISILSNIAEGFDRSGNKEFIQFLSIAKGSASELRAQLYVAFDLNYLSKDEFDYIFQLINEIGKMLTGLMNYLKSTEMKGSKFNEPEVLYNTQTDKS